LRRPRQTLRSLTALRSPSHQLIRSWSNPSIPQSIPCMSSTRCPEPRLSNTSDSYMSGTGLLVTAWPFVLGCDAAGVVVEIGDNAGSKLKIGDEVCGCTRLGVPGHATAQEFVSTPTMFSLSDLLMLEHSSSWMPC